MKIRTTEKFKAKNEYIGKQGRMLTHEEAKAKVVACAWLST